MKDPKITTMVKHSTSKFAWNVVGTTIGNKYKIAIVPYLDYPKLKEEARQHAEFISYCFNNSKAILK